MVIRIGSAPLTGNNSDSEASSSASSNFSTSAGSDERFYSRAETIREYLLTAQKDINLVRALSARLHILRSSEHEVPRLAADLKGSIYEAARMLVRADHGLEGLISFQGGLEASTKRAETFNELCRLGRWCAKSVAREARGEEKERMTHPAGVEEDDWLDTRAELPKWINLKDLSGEATRQMAQNPFTLLLRLTDSLGLASAGGVIVPDSDVSDDEQALLQAKHATASPRTATKAQSTVQRLRQARQRFKRWYINSPTPLGVRPSSTRSLGRRPARNDLEKGIDRIGDALQRRADRRALESRKGRRAAVITSGVVLVGIAAAALLYSGLKGGTEETKNDAASTAVDGTEFRTIAPTMVGHAAATLRA